MTVEVVDQVQCTGCKGMLCDLWICLINDLFFKLYIYVYIYICKFYDVSTATPPSAGNECYLDFFFWLFLFFSLLAYVAF